jgi:hypothetical protein|tara:strand:- start:190 stop:486 length:297 start_codon:yes stop_codon:yes gene_type:complete
LRYWSQLIVVKNENDDKDMPVAFMVTDVVKNYGKDLTKTSLSTGELGQESDEILLDIFNAKTLKHVLYLSGILYWRNKNITRWHFICLPIRRAMTFVA